MPQCRAILLKLGEFFFFFSPFFLYFYFLDLFAQGNLCKNSSWPQAKATVNSETMCNKEYKVYGNSLEN